MNTPLPATDGADLPPPSAELLSAVATMKPVKTSVPGRILIALFAAGLLVPLVALAAQGLRKDFWELPTAWLVAMAALWAAAAALPLFAAILPRRGEVLPDAARARVVSLTATVTLLIAGLFATVDAPGVTLVPARAFDAAWRHCILFGLQVTLPVLLVTIYFLRRSLPGGARAVAAAVGVGSGALAGLSLHVLCGFGGGLHVGLAHAGGMALGGALGMLLVPRFLRA
jgi:hypothetical protein